MMPSQQPGSDLVAVSLKTPKAPRQCQMLGRSRRRAPRSPRSAGKWRAMAGAHMRALDIAAPRFARGESRADRGDGIELRSLFRVERTVSVGTWISGKWLQSIDAHYLAFLTDQLLDYAAQLPLHVLRFSALAPE